MMIPSLRLGSLATTAPLGETAEENPEYEAQQRMRSRCLATEPRSFSLCFTSE